MLAASPTSFPYILVNNTTASHNYILFALTSLHLTHSTTNSITITTTTTTNHFCC